jgi:hypothetical protein
MSKFINPFESSGRWFKANLHTHTTVSDGKISPSQRVEQYRRAGYDVLALTDHHATNDILGLSDRRMLVVSGIELHPPCRLEKTSHHFVVLGVPHGFQVRKGAGANECIEQARKAGGVVILAHPFWTGLQFTAIKGLRGLSAVEVYNTTCAGCGRPCSENEWAYMLDHGLRLPAVGVDDAHCAEGRDVFGSWTWLKMPARTVSNVLKAVRTGCCYASCGPVIHDFRVSGGKLRLRCSPAQAIHFSSGPGTGACRLAEGDDLVRHFSINVPKWSYVRAVVTDARGRKAWTNPIWLR